MATAVAGVGYAIIAVVRPAADAPTSGADGGEGAADRRPVGAQASPSSPLLLLGLWVGFLRYFDVNPYVAKSPSAAWDWLNDPARGEGGAADLRRQLGDVEEAALGFVVGLAVAIAVAIIFTLSRRSSGR